MFSYGERVPGLFSCVYRQMVSIRSSLYNMRLKIYGSNIPSPITTHTRRARLTVIPTKSAARWFCIWPDNLHLTHTYTNTHTTHSELSAVHTHHHEVRYRNSTLIWEDFLPAAYYILHITSRKKKKEYYNSDFFFITHDRHFIPVSQCPPKYHGYILLFEEISSSFIIVLQL